MSETIFPIQGRSLGKSPFSMSLPNKLQSNLRKYSCLGKDKKLRESVNIPTKTTNDSHIGERIDLIRHPFDLV